MDRSCDVQKNINRIKDVLKNLLTYLQEAKLVYPQADKAEIRQKCIIDAAVQNREKDCEMLNSANICSKTAKTHTDVLRKR